MMAKVKKGTGYWKLNLNPWGGDFNRFIEDEDVEVVSIPEIYNDGSPKKIIVISKKTGNNCGLNGEDVKLLDE